MFFSKQPEAWLDGISWLMLLIAVLLLLTGKKRFFVVSKLLCFYAICFQLILCFNYILKG